MHQQATRKKLSGKVAQKSGVISVKEVRAKTIAQDQDEVDKAKRALARAENKILREKEAVEKGITKAWKAVGKELRVVIKAYKKSRSEEQIVWRSIHVELKKKARLATLSR